MDQLKSFSCIDVANKETKIDILNHESSISHHQHTLAMIEYGNGQIQSRLSKHVITK